MKAKTTNQILKSALRLIQKGWTKGTYARDKRSRGVEPQDKRACRFCAYGALARAAGSWDVPQEVEQAISGALGSALQDVAVGESMGWADIVTWNDDKTTTKSQVVTAFKSAIRATA